MVTFRFKVHANLPGAVGLVKKYAPQLLELMGQEIAKRVKVDEKTWGYKVTEPGGREWECAVGGDRVGASK